MPSPLRLLVISHSGEATGAAIALLRIMRWCVSDNAVKPIFVLRSNGALVGEFRKLGRTFVYSALTDDRLDRLYSHIPHGTGFARVSRRVRCEWLRFLCRRERADLIYINTGLLGEMVPALAPLGLPVVNHVHELERTLTDTDNLDGLQTLIESSELVFAASRAVEAMLIRHGAEPGRVLEIQEPVDEQPLLTDEQRRTLRRDVLRADDETIVVAACGFPGWRKGTDIFLRVAQSVLAANGAHRKIAFRWIGGEDPDWALSTLLHDVAQLGLDGAVSSVGQVPDAERLLGAVDVFISTSREDPNPLVVLEAAAAARPIVCFRGAGGAEELADLGAAKAIPFLDSEAMATAITVLIGSPQERARLGDAARAAVLSRNATSVVGRRVADALRQINAPRDATTQ